MSDTPRNGSHLSTDMNGRQRAIAISSSSYSPVVMSPAILSTQVVYHLSTTMSRQPNWLLCMLGFGEDGVIGFPDAIGLCRGLRGSPRRGRPWWGLTLGGLEATPGARPDRSPRLFRGRRARSAEDLRYRPRRGWPRAGHAARRRHIGGRTQRLPLEESRQDRKNARLRAGRPSRRRWHRRIQRAAVAARCPLGLAPREPDTGRLARPAGLASSHREGKPRGRSDAEPATLSALRPPALRDRPAAATGILPLAPAEPRAPGTTPMAHAGLRRVDHHRIRDRLDQDLFVA